MATLPSLEAIRTSPSDPSSPLAVALDLLFEHSPILTEKLEPQLSAKLKSSSPELQSYPELIDAALEQLAQWDLPCQAQFIAGHPRIGETKNLSTLSNAEQGGNVAVNPTLPVVLLRLDHLNACYERTYPGLRYITFVNGRSRATIANEMEDALGIPHSLSNTEPEIASLTPIEQGSEQWKLELHRAVRDIGFIAKSRVKEMGI